MNKILRDSSYGIIPIFRDEEGWRILVLQHKAGHWGFPKGHARTHETALNAAEREFREESGITNYKLVTDKKFKQIYKHSAYGPLTEKTVTYFPAEVPGLTQPTLQKEEIVDYKWAAPEDLLKLLPANSQTFLVEIYRYLVSMPKV